MLKSLITSVFALLLLSSSCELEIRAPQSTGSDTNLSHQWSLKNGPSSIDLTSTPNEAAMTYYAVHNADPGTLTGDDLQALATSCSGSCVAAGSFSSTSTGTTQSISGLAQKVLYTVTTYSITSSGKASSVKKYTSVLPRKNTLLTFTSALTSEQGVGMTIRYYASVPDTYYDQASSTFPVLLYIHGFGDQSNNAANPESDFSKMDQTVISGKLAMGDSFQSIVIQPQCNEALWNCQNYQSTTMSTPYLAEVIDQIHATFRSNPKKTAAMGMSFGASGAIHLAYDYPTKVSAVVAIAGGLFTSGTRPAAAGNLCPKFATEPVAIWAFSNTSDPLYNLTGVTTGATGPVGTYPGTFISTINTNCSGQPDARFTELTESALFPTNCTPHHISELVLNGPYWDYFDECGTGGADRWKRWNGSAAIPDTDPPSVKVALHPTVTSALSTTSTALTGSSSTFTTVFDWAVYFSKP